MIRLTKTGLCFFVTLGIMTLVSLVFWGCDVSILDSVPTQTPSPTVTLTRLPTKTASPTPIPTATQKVFPTHNPTPTVTPIVPDTGWEILRPGLERRQINFFDDSGFHVEKFYILRIEPENYHFTVAYNPRGQALEDWYAETGALIIVNGGYFREDGDHYVPTGLTIVNGQVIGVSYGEFAGMFTISDAGPAFRWMAQAPYSFGEPIRAALQSFPILVKPGGVLGFPAQFEDYHDARRTVIGEDTQGRILILVASHGFFTLHRLSLYLTESDLQLDFALNLDGGPSSGILVSDPWEMIAAYSLLPVVITIHPFSRK